MAAAFPGFPGNGPVLASELSASERERLKSAISDRGIDFVGQELVRLSTTPVWEAAAITPRPFVLRVFAAATPEGWTIMPGGFCRIAEQPDARAVSMGDGARAADVWVVSDKAVSASTLLPAIDTVRIRRIAGVVPSRAADNLFWLGRYLERAEATLRLIRALGTQTRDPAKGSSTALHSAERIQRLLVTWGATSQTARSQSAKVAAEALQSEEKFGSALSLVRSAQRTATSLRERLSPDAWQVITEMIGAPRVGGRRRRRRRQRGRIDFAGARELCRPGAGKHESRRRLAFPRHGPPRRARHQHHALRAPVRL